MKGSFCIASPATALARVFLSGHGKQCVGNGPHSVPPFLAPRSSSATGLLWMLPASRRYAHQQPPNQWPQISRIPTARPADNGHGSKSGGGSDSGIRGGDSQRPARSDARSVPIFGPGGGGGGDNYRNANDSGSKPSTKSGRLPRDKEITYRYVILRQEDGSLSDPQPTSAILSRLNLTLKSLVMLAMPQAEEDQDAEGNFPFGSAVDGRGGPPRFPICKIVDRVAERKAEYEKARELRRKKTLSKELELNWAIDKHDLEHRLEKLREFLERGLRVEVSMLRKFKGKGRRHATQEEAAELLRRVRETVLSVPGARESKPMEGELLRVAKLVVDGPARKADK